MSMCCLCSPGERTENNQREHANFRSTQTWESRIAQPVFACFSFKHYRKWKQQFAFPRFTYGVSIYWLDEDYVSFARNGMMQEWKSEQYEISRWRKRGEEETMRDWIMLAKRNEAFAINLKYYDIMSPTSMPNYPISNLCRLVVFCYSVSESLGLFMCHRKSIICHLRCVLAQCEIISSLVHRLREHLRRAGRRR